MFGRPVSELPNTLFYRELFQTGAAAFCEDHHAAKLAVALKYPNHRSVKKNLIFTWLHRKKVFMMCSNPCWESGFGQTRIQFKSEW
jgi:hypothetical protein